MAVSKKELIPSKKEFFILQEAEDFLYRKKDSIKEENWIKGEVVETLNQVYLKIKN